MSPSSPALVAIRPDDGGTWQTLEIRDGGYAVPIAARFTLVVVCAHWAGSYVEVRHWTAGDNHDFALSCLGFDGEPLSDLHPTFAPGEVIQTVATGGMHERCSNSGSDWCRLRNGTHDAIALHGARDVQRARIIRDFQIFDGARFDADASKGWLPDRRTLEVVSDFHGGNGSVYTLLETRRGDALLYSGKTYWGKFPDHVEQEYLRVPDAERLATDCDVLEVQGTRMCLRDAPRTRIEIKTREVPPMRYDSGAHTLVFSLADADALNVSVRSGGSSSPSWNIIATRRWLGDATQYTLPELATIPGWRPVWSHAVGERIDGRLIWGPKPSSHQSRPRLWQPLRPGDRMDTAGANVETGSPK